MALTAINISFKEVFICALNCEMNFFKADFDQNRT